MDDLIKIDSENILFNFFSKGVNEISYESLRKLREKIEKHLNYSVYVDIVDASLRNTTFRHSDYFEMGITKIFCKREIDNNIVNLYNSKLPSEIKKKYLSCFSSTRKTNNTMEMELIKYKSREWGRTEEQRKMATECNELYEKRIYNSTKTMSFYAVSKCTAKSKHVISYTKSNKHYTMHLCERHYRSHTAWLRRINVIFTEEVKK